MCAIIFPAVINLPPLPLEGAGMLRPPRYVSFTFNAKGFSPLIYSYSSFANFYTSRVTVVAFLSNPSDRFSNRTKTWFLACGINL